MEQRYINGIQQVGIGVADARQAFDWYKRNFGTDILVFEDTAIASLMQRYTGNKAHQRHALLAMNLQGGGGLEIWQYTNRMPAAPTAPPRLGDWGIFAIKIKCVNIQSAYQKLKQVATVTPIARTPYGWEHFFVQDPWGNWFDVVEWEPMFAQGKHATAGVAGAIIGVSNLQASTHFYQNVLGYTETWYTGNGIFADWQALDHGHHAFNRVLLARPQKATGAFGKLLGPSVIELVQVLSAQAVKIYHNRYWGDLGFIHLCFDINGMEAHEQSCAAAGHPLTVNSRNSFDMGKAAGHFAYNEDPDGTLIEYVETHKVPIAKKWGWYLNLAHRNPQKTLPDWMVKCLRFSRVK
jgi:catechol 2,3-dioxygenase-like lactoylglutathione lyase family enzyme/uncharacterized glyoxalase superfamily protein PhnB